MNHSELIKQAEQVLKNSYSPYSGFAVGAVVLTSNNSVFTGTNVENAVFGLTVCAERTAIFKAVSEGFKDLKALAVVADTEDVCRPCGSCRQVFMEFNPDMEIIMGNLRGKIKTVRASDLLPVYFSGVKDKHV